ncbi:MAG: hypothetical protein ACI9Y1_001078 [Lentisphaeria bacterium]
MVPLCVYNRRKILTHYQGHEMNKLKTLGLLALGQLTFATDVMAASVATTPTVPELNGTGAIVAIALTASVITYVREKIRKK